MVSPALQIGQRVYYTEDGILSMIRGQVRAWRFNGETDQVEYQVQWDRENDTDEVWYPKSRLIMEESCP